ncbi:MAG TPA: RagB/SusD family nutrient uptake outer membrane protein [Lacibacter sp.]|nr:RagB/SusD family nutrient uptake outer membrane protein [Lacibacter sp.]HMO88033.1 RagB/SusD family nutrient uptake outer membrane protein [Lacibacter sp.]HMP85903.1 RagB/SusD family nutrient uptake outer membrane protein [Lacibacter sp.]
MKNFIKASIPILVLLTFILLLGSCKKGFLDVTPKGRLIAIKTADYDLMLNSPNLINYGLAPLLTALGDEVIAREPFFGVRPLLDQRLFRYEDDIYNPEDDPTQLNNHIRVLYHYNKIINEVMKSEDGSEIQKKAILAEALTGRAWIYLGLSNMFTKPFNPATAATDPGFPLITEADITRTPYARGTVQAVYDLMISDLITAIPDLPSVITSRHRASKAVAQALLGKVYLAMGRYADALPVLEAAIGTITSNTGLPTRLYDYNIEMFAGGVMFSSTMATNGPLVPTSPNFIESLYGRQETNLTNANINNYFVLSPQAGALYAATDHRRRFYNNVNLSYPAGSLRRLAPFIQQTGINIPEVYLMRAECRARANNLYGAGSAETDLVFLRQRRLPLANAAIPTGLSQEQLIRYVIEERLRELAFTGIRWFDMRRLSLDPLYSNTTYIHKLYFADGTVTDFPLRPERLTLRIPGRILRDNPGMEDNP